MFQLPASGNPYVDDHSIVPLIRARIRSVMNVVGHGVGSVEDRDCFIWETLLHFASDVIKNWQNTFRRKYASAVSALAFARCFWRLEEVERGFYGVALSVCVMATARLYKPKYTASLIYLLMTIFMRLASVCARTRLQLDF